MTRILLTGKNGQVGWELQKTLAPIGDVIAVDLGEFDLASPDSIRSAVRKIKPSLIVNAAAYTAVDKAKEEPELAMAVNGTAPGILAEEAKRIGAAIVHYSTDYVFDGSKTVPYTEEDEPNPINVYGKTKLAGDRAIQAVGGPFLILRTSWVYSNRGKNFLLTILRLAQERDELKVVDDQIGAPTWARTIADSTARVLAKLPLPPGEGWGEGGSGIYHMTASNFTSWYGFAKKILELSSRITHHRSPRLVPIETHNYPTPASRPKNSRLDNSKLIGAFGFVPPNWEVMLKECIHEMADDSNNLIAIHD